MKRFTDSMVNVDLSDVKLEQVARNEIKTVFVPMDVYENEKRIFSQSYPNGDEEMEMFYEILFSVYVTYKGKNGVLCFMYNTPGSAALEETSELAQIVNKDVMAEFKQLLNRDDIDLFERDIYDRETLEEEGIPVKPGFLLMWLAAALVADSMTPYQVFSMGQNNYSGKLSPYSNCEPNWFNYPVKLTISTNFDLLDAVQEWLRTPSHFNLFRGYCSAAKELGITVKAVEKAAENI